MGCRIGFGDLSDGRPFWIGDFNGDGRDDVLFYTPADGNWWLGVHDGIQLAWSYAGNTLGVGAGDPNFGQIWDGRPFWVGNFAGSAAKELLFYTPADGNWWLGSYAWGQLRWSYAGNTRGRAPGSPDFGQIWDGRPFWTGDFAGGLGDDVLFYTPADGNWWPGSHDGTQLGWSYAGNTRGARTGEPDFGQIADGRPVWTGDFTGTGRADVLFYSRGDGNWWLGSHDGNKLGWGYAGNTRGRTGGDPDFGQIWDGRPFWVGDFARSGRKDVLFYTPADGNWWQGAHDGARLSWSFAGNTRGAKAGDPDFGQIWDGRPFWCADITGDTCDDLLFYTPADGNWWLGSHRGGRLSWSFAGNTLGFGQVWDGRPFWTGDFNGAGNEDVLFYFPGDGNWWLGSHNGGQLAWGGAGNTGVPSRVKREAKPWAILLCKFEDNISEPLPREHYERLFTPKGDGHLNMVDYFDHMSHCHVDVSGSRVFGWFTIKKKKSDYKGSGANQQGRTELIDWAKAAAMAGGTNLGPFGDRVVVCMNVPTDVFGGTGGVATDSVSMRPSTLGQEMGHGFGLEHSRIEGSTVDYRDRWDTMSTLNAFMAQHPEFSLVGPGLNAANMRSKGWLDESRLWRGPSGSFDEIVQLRPLHHRELPGWLCIELPGGFLAEFRVPSDWDAAIPRATVLVHRFEAPSSVLMRRTSPAVPPPPQGEQDVFAEIVTGCSFQASIGGAGASRTVRLQTLAIDPVGWTATVRVQQSS